MSDTVTPSRTLSAIASALALGAASLGKLTADAAAQVVPLNLHAANEIIITHAQDAADFAEAVASAPAADAAVADHIVELTARTAALEKLVADAGLVPTPIPAPTPTPAQ